jgi:predicted amidophosphoribosyltransferase
MAGKFEYEKVCKVCGNTFTAQKSTTNYCRHCAEPMNGNYCAHCGQATRLERIDGRYLVREIAETLGLNGRL